MISVSLFIGAFNVESFRAGIEAVPQSTIEAAESLGYTRWGIFCQVTFPLAVRVSLPALGNNLVELVKTTNLAYAIAVPELMYTSKQIWGDSINVPEMMFTVLFAYVALNWLLALVLHLIERWLWIPGFGEAIS